MRPHDDTVQSSRDDLAALRARQDRPGLGELAGRELPDAGQPATGVAHLRLRLVDAIATGSETVLERGGAGDRERLRADVCEQLGLGGLKLTGRALQLSGSDRG